MRSYFNCSQALKNLFPINACCIQRFSVFGKDTYFEISLKSCNAVIIHNEEKKAVYVAGGLELYYYFFVNYLADNHI